MKAIIEKGRASGNITAPPSKSVAHRYLICGAISSGVTEITGLPKNEDIRATVDCLGALGFKVETNGDKALVYGADCRSHPRRDGSVRKMPCFESGSTLRFLLPLTLDGVPTEFSCAGRLPDRPLGVYEDICRRQNIMFTPSDKGVYLCGRLAGGDFELPGNVSSQFISGLLFAAPRLTCNSRIILTSPLESAPYVHMTLDALEKFGIDVEYNGVDEFFIKGGQNGVSPRRLGIPGDYSGAAVFGALNVIGGNVAISGLEADSIQGDRVWKEIFPRLAAGTPTVSLADCPDLGPILMATAAVMNGALFRDTARLRYKESDRIAAMEEELGKCGVKLSVTENSVYVPGGCASGPAEFFGHGDHRIVMALAVLATVVGGSVDGAEAVGKSMSEFWSLLRAAGIKFRLAE